MAAADDDDDDDDVLPAAAFDEDFVFTPATIIIIIIIITKLLVYHHGHTHRQPESRMPLALFQRWRDIQTKILLKFFNLQVSPTVNNALK